MCYLDCCSWILSNDPTLHKLWFILRSPFYAICCHKKIVQGSPSNEKPLCWIFTTWSWGKQGAKSINQAVEQTIASKVQTSGSRMLSFRAISKCPLHYWSLSILLVIFFFSRNWKLCPVLQEIFHPVSLCGRNKV